VLSGNSVALPCQAWSQLSLVCSSLDQNFLVRVRHNLALNTQVGWPLLYIVGPFDFIVENQSAEGKFDFSHSVKAANTGMFAISKAALALVFFP
jgi:hypothetical protein